MQRLSLDALARVLGALPGAPRVVTSGNFATPRAALAALDGAVAEYRLFVLNAQPGLPDRDGVRYETVFVGPGMRGSARLDYFPSRLSLVPALLHRHLRPDVVLIHTTTPTDGTVSLGIEVNVLPAAIDAARRHGGIVVAAANPAMPTTYGDATVPVDSIDYLVEVEEPIAHSTPGTADDLSVRIGNNVARLVPDGATLQLGIGGVPNATLAALQHRRGLGVWTETFSDGVMALERAGCTDPSRPLTSSFVFGSREFYAWVDRNRRIQMLRSEKTNDPALIAGHRQLFSINGALQVDLFAQANASRIGGRIYSGFGGQTDFIVGALHSPGGKAIIALPSWHPRADVSTVVPLLDGPVTSFQHSYVVTEQGVATVWGQDAVTQAQNLVDHAAHPAARGGLVEAARNLGLPISGG